MTIYIGTGGAPLTNWYNKVLPQVRGCLEAVALDQIREAVIDFCERTWVLNGDLPPIDAVANQAIYPYVPPSDRLVVKRLEVWFNGLSLIDKTPDDIRTIYPDAWETQSGTPLFHTAHDARNVRLVPYPTAALPGALKMRVTYKPVSTIATIDTLIWEDYRELIAAGARMRLFMMANMPWASEKKADAERGMYEGGIDHIRFKVQRGFGRAPARVRASFL